MLKLILPRPSRICRSLNRIFNLRLSTKIIQLQILEKMSFDSPLKNIAHLIRLKPVLIVTFFEDKQTVWLHQM